MGPCGNPLPKSKSAFSPFEELLGMSWGLPIINNETSSMHTAAGVQVSSQPDEVFNVLGYIGLGFELLAHR